MKPIIFSTPMVQAILDGKKTQTRRVIKDRHQWIATDETLALHCPYGQVGSGLWVRETWSGADWEDDLPPSDMSQEAGLLNYKATPNELSDCFAGKWRPSIFMPRWASRITLEITEVRVERVQDISPPDISAEGYDPFGIPAGVFWFKDLWDSINAKRGYGWDSNPFVWCISFRRVE